MKHKTYSGQTPESSAQKPPICFVALYHGPDDKTLPVRLTAVVQDPGTGEWMDDTEFWFRDATGASSLFDAMFEVHELAEAYGADIVEGEGFAALVKCECGCGGYETAVLGRAVDLPLQTMPGPTGVN